QLEERAGPALEHAVERAREQAHELGELSREEAETIANYVRRDLHDAAIYMEESSEEMGDWLRFDLQQVEARLAENFLQVADRTRVELAQLAEQAQRIGEWHTGEITSIGTLRCMNCGEELHFTRTGRIPPCPKCTGSRFKRVYSGE
ncbi:MAG: zinc ribbon-containing protein, partial [Thiohalospira sp.]